MITFVVQGKCHYANPDKIQLKWVSIKCLKPS